MISSMFCFVIISGFPCSPIKGVKSFFTVGVKMSAAKLIYANADRGSLKKELLDLIFNPTVCVSN